MSLDRLPQRCKSRCGRGQFLPQPSADITYIPVQRGFLYLVAIMDWATRRVLSWRLSNTLDAGFCVEALAEALDCYGRPEIFNTDQGSQFTSFEFTAVVKNAAVAISMDGRGRCMDNIFIERLWRSLKYEAVYRTSSPTASPPKKAIVKWLNFYNTTKPHSALAGATPAESYEKDGRRSCSPNPTACLPLSTPLPVQPEHHDRTSRIHLNSAPRPTNWDHLKHTAVSFSGAAGRMFSTDEYGAAAP